MDVLADCKSESEMERVCLKAEAEHYKKLVTEGKVGDADKTSSRKSIRDTGESNSSSSELKGLTPTQLLAQGFGKK